MSRACAAGGCISQPSARNVPRCLKRARARPQPGAFVAPLMRVTPPAAGRSADRETRMSWPVRRILSQRALPSSPWMVIPLGPPLLAASSNLPVCIRWITATKGKLRRILLGFAPGGVYLADLVTQAAGGLLHHRFTLTPQRIAKAVCFLWHWPAGHPGWLLATTVSDGVRTFLTRPAGAAATIQPTHPPH